MNLNALISEQVKLVQAFPSAVPSTATPKYVSMKNHERLAIVLMVQNATTVTGSAITINQATAVAGTGAKALAFTTAYRDIDTGTADALTAFAVSSNTFTTDSTNSKALLYVIEVKAEDLDVNGGFDCVSVGLGNATAATVTALYLLAGEKFPTSATALTD